MGLGAHINSERADLSARTNDRVARRRGRRSNDRGHNDKGDAHYLIMGRAIREALLAYRMRLEVGHRDELERRGMSRLENDWGGDARLERLLPAGGDDAPTVSRP